MTREIIQSSKESGQENVGTSMEGPERTNWDARKLRCARRRCGRKRHFNSQYHV